MTARDAWPPVRGATPFPSHLIDQVMPLLKDTEWRILCVIVRQTLGWKVGEGRQRKRSDWLTQSQLKARTGRETAALSQAIDTLVRRGLIEVRNDEGEPLLSPEERRRSHGRLFYRLCPGVLQNPGPGAGETNARAEPAGKSEQDTSKTEHSCSETEFRKANITKETGTKYIPYGIERSGIPSPAQDRKQDGKEIKESRTGQPPGSKPPNPDVKRFLQIYQKAFQRRSAYGEPPPLCWGKDGKLVKELLKTYPYERLVELLGQFFESGDPWIRRRGYSLDAFRAAIGPMLINKPRTSTHTSGRWTHIREILGRQE